MVLLSDNITIEDRISNLNKEYLEAQQKENTENNIPGEIILNNIEEITDELKLLMIKFDRINDLISRNKISISDYSEIIQQVNQDLNKNKSALKLRNLGANFNIKVSKNTCPTCFQNIVDNLLAEDIKGPQMDLEEQIEYLKSQKKMLENQIEGLNLENSNLTMKLNNTKKEIDRKNEVIRSLKKSITSGTELSKLYLRQQIYIENEIHQLQELKKLIQETKIKFNELIAEYKKVKSDLDKLPKDLYNLSDRKKISSFEKHFQNNAKKFQYNSAPISDITINMDNLLPSLNHIELREIRKSNIKVDSSASDFVRLIWSFLLGLQQIGHDYACNNLNLILLDEPGQHSMALSSQRALFAELASISNLQSIVAASFDNSEENFQEITNGLKFKLISWDGKLIKPFRE
ncbi:hypothetical protein ABTI33_16055 [Acinetobacter baumannii]|nr:hypothetical protein [Acinetobacter baumannii]MDA3554541.1 hypothetical protein [Acinetobacter baumannii]